MTFFNSGSILHVFGLIGICGICVGFLCFAYKIIYGLFYYNNTTKIFDANQDNRFGSNTDENECDDIIISITNITTFDAVSSENIPEYIIIDNDKNLPIATIV